MNGTCVDESGNTEVLADKRVLVPLCNAEDEGNADFDF